jgi:chromosome condensin MukBEF ATPase and DNA-binding subunit MukB
MTHIEELECRINNQAVVIDSNITTLRYAQARFLKAEDRVDHLQSRIKVTNMMLDILKQNPKNPEVAELIVMVQASLKG